MRVLVVAMRQTANVREWTIKRVPKDQQETKYHNWRLIKPDGSEEILANRRSAVSVATGQAETGHRITIHGNRDDIVSSFIHHD